MAGKVRQIFQLPTGSLTRRGFGNAQIAFQTGSPRGRRNREIRRSMTHETRRVRPTRQSPAGNRPDFAGPAAAESAGAAWARPAHPVESLFGPNRIATPRSIPERAASRTERARFERRRDRPKNAARFRIVGNAGRPCLSTDLGKIGHNLNVAIRDRRTQILGIDPPQIAFRSERCRRRRWGHSRRKDNLADWPRQSCDRFRFGRCPGYGPGRHRPVR